MREAVAEINFEMLTDDSDLVSVLQVLHRNIAKSQQSMGRWREEYKDLRGDPDFDSSFLSDIEDPLFQEEASKLDPEPSSCNKAISTVDYCLGDLRRNHDDSGHCDSSLMTSGVFDCDDDTILTAGGDDVTRDEEEYFEVNSVASEATEIGDDRDPSLRELVERLRKAKELVASKNDEVEEMIAGVRREATESCSLRERIGMNHRSLTLLERRQEKLMREALYENVTASTRVRHLQDEVIQLRIRDSQHQSDIQRLMAENARLKLKLMEVRTRHVVASTPRAPVGLASLEEPPAEEEPRPAARLTPIALPGLLDMDDLDRPVCDRVIQRGTMPTFDQTECKALTEEIILHESTAVTKEKRCPLCNHSENNPDKSTSRNNTTNSNSHDSFEDSSDNDFDFWSTFYGTSKRSVGTSTHDLNPPATVSLRQPTVNVMGLQLPMPLFLACLLRTIEDTMAMVGRVCFAEITPYDPEFPELQVDFVEFMKSMHGKFNELYRRKQD